MKRLIASICLSMLVSANAYSYTECSRPVKDVWINLNGSNVNVMFSDGGSLIRKDETQLSQSQMARFMAVVLTAQATGKNLKVRYPEDGMTCPPTGSTRNDIDGVWIQN